MKPRVFKRGDFWFVTRPHGGVLCRNWKVAMITALYPVGGHMKLADFERKFVGLV
jgi:hypothetical protein